MRLAACRAASRLSKGPRQAKHVLGDVAEDEIGRDRRDQIQTRLPELALDVVLGSEAESAMRLEADVRRLPRRLRREVLGHVGLGTASLTAVETIARLEPHQVSRLDLHIGLGDWKGDALVLTDRAAENDTLAGVLGGAVDEPVAIADAFGGDQRALGVESVEHVLETLPLFADQVLRGNLEVVEEQLVGLVIDHVADWPDREPLA